jgi:hypothetical protein
MGWWSDAWDTVTDAVETVWDGVTTVGGAIVDTIEILISPFSIILAMTVGWIEAIPIIGSVVEWILNVVTTIIWYGLGIVDFILSMIGIRPEKKLRACVIVLSDSKGPMASDQDIITVMTAFSNTFKEQANVRVIKSALGQYTSAFSDLKPPTADWISHPDASSDEILQAECGWDGVGADFNTDGSRYEALSLLTSPWNYLRRLIGYGAPIFIFIVRNFSDPSKNGCSLGPVSDYVLVAGNPLKPGSNGLVKDIYLIAHESGHACNLTHSSAGYDYPISNLMYPQDTRTSNYLTRWQISVLRGSRHATYF